MDLKDIRLYVDDRPAEGVFRVHRDVYSDPELFELEQKFIFERTWNFLALESQIAKPNDFVAAHVGRTPVLATRDAKGRLGAFVNVCRHKGAMLCAAGERVIWRRASTIGRNATPPMAGRSRCTTATRRPGSTSPSPRSGRSTRRSPRSARASASCAPNGCSRHATCTSSRTCRSPTRSL